MTKEALKLALEALDTIVDAIYINSQQEAEAVLKANDAITAIKEALRENAMREVQRLGQEIEQEPVVGITAIRTWFKDGRVVTQTLCNSWVDTTPPQRSESSGKPSAWVGLTDEEKSELWEISRAAWPRYITYASLAEAKLKEKNT